MAQEYDKHYHSYPVWTEEMGPEGAFKRLRGFPQPKEIFDYALLGLPKTLPLTGEMMTPEIVAPFLESAINEIEMEVGCNLSEITHFHSVDYIDGMFTNNYMGVRLPRWPATQITQMVLKYPHTNTKDVYQKYTLPAGWIYLRRNKVNVVAAIGSVTVSTDNAALVTAGGIFTYITGFGRGAYQPGTVEVVYKAGFEHDKMPAAVADLVKTWTAHRFLTEVYSTLFPQSGVSVSVDGVGQSVQFNITQMLDKRVDLLEKKKHELAAALTKQFSKTIKMTFLGT
jgi:hypothetical protein